MNIQFHYKHINEVIKSDLERYVQAKLEDLMRYAPEASEGSQMATVTIEHFEKHDAYHVDIRLVLRDGKEMQLQAEETKHTYSESIDAVRDKLQAQLLKKKDKTLASIKTKVLPTARKAA